METIKVMVKRFDPDDDDVRFAWNDDFVNDLVRNEGKVITLHDYTSDGDTVLYLIKSENGVFWNQRTGPAGTGQWRCDDDVRISNKVFLRIVETVFDEELFII